MGEIDGGVAWRRLVAAVLLSTIGGVGMWSVVVVMPAVQAEFGVDRAATSLPFTMVMLGFGVGGVAFGRLADRTGVAAPMALGTLLMAAGYAASAAAPGIPAFALLFFFIGAGSSACFGPLVADISCWFLKRRGLAVAICASGNYLAGAFWPPVVERSVALWGWRATHVGVALFCVATMIPLALLLRRRAPAVPSGAAGAVQAFADPVRALRISPARLQTLLALAGVACCVAMAMPQAHIVSYCGDLGYGAARGAEMLSLMLACGIISRIGCGFIADRIGGLGALFLSSVAQGVALALYLMFDSLPSLYVISALFGLFQGGLVPSYAIIVREYFPAGEAGGRVGVLVFATVIGMALGGWMSGLIFDVTGSYQAAFLNGLMFNLMNGGVVLFLLLRQRGLHRPAMAAA
ncbi:MFS transporter [Camelimonas abortus]|uniref:MFS transporter n=1 Tax=Camelimonas abortus TaxID=1017184 RepID=A0ABV7LFQ9_9HYPH